MCWYDAARCRAPIEGAWLFIVRSVYRAESHMIQRYRAAFCTGRAWLLIGRLYMGGWRRHHSTRVLLVCWQVHADHIPEVTGSLTLTRLTRRGRLHRCRHVRCHRHGVGGGPPINVTAWSGHLPHLRRHLIAVLPHHRCSHMLLVSIWIRWHPSIRWHITIHRHIHLSTGLLYWSSHTWDRNELCYSPLPSQSKLLNYTGGDRARAFPNIDSQPS